MTTLVAHDGFASAPTGCASVPRGSAPWRTSVSHPLNGGPPARTTPRAHHLRAETTCADATQRSSHG
jgi:hypothetical protein